MQQVIKFQEKRWLNTTFDVLHEHPKHLQKLILQISRQNPDMGFYASDLARLRMSGMEMENLLTRIWNADSPSRVDQIVETKTKMEHPCSGALNVFADLIKNHLSRTETNIH